MPKYRIYTEADDKDTVQEFACPSFARMAAREVRDRTRGDVRLCELDEEGDERMFTEEWFVFDESLLPA